ncbi:hypothetical protein [Nonomuraea gerenzanensis]|uniref:hypothetical protein n=1 Tax=Nonomuraea gerenzanensis TaxID=93944 RepID=UPI001CDA165E|nr:hypothetical protein LCN96_39335 [Nonomuraea gerenzanensis]
MGYHLYKAYPKLGVASRAELARLGLDEGGRLTGRRRSFRIIHATLAVTTQRKWLIFSGQSPDRFDPLNPGRSFPESPATARRCSPEGNE